MKKRLEIKSRWWQQYWQDVLIHIGFITWTILAIVFCEERLFSDAGFYLAKIVHYETFWIEVNRFIRIFSQWIPLLLVRLGAPMTTVIIGYSIGHILFYYGCYIIARLVYGHKEAGWVFLLLQTIGLLYGFCSPGFEYYYVAAFIVLWWLALQQEMTITNIIWQLILLFFIITGYRTALIFVLAVLGLHFAEHRWRYWKYYMGIVFYMAIWWIFKSTYITSYEQEKMDWTWYLILNHTFEWDYYQQLVFFYWEYYKSMWLLIGITIMIYTKHQKWKLLFCYIVGLLLVQYLVSISYSAIKHSRYQEQCYFPMSIMAVLPLLLHAVTLLQERYQRRLLVGIFFIVLYRLILIPSAIKPYSERVALQHRLIEEGRARDGSKFIIQQDFNPLIADLTFGFNMETLLLSSLDSTKQTVQIIREGEWRKLEKEGKNPLHNIQKYMGTYKSYYDRPDSIYTHEEQNYTYYHDFEAGSYHWLSGAAPLLKDMTLIRDQVILEGLPRLHYSAEKAYNIMVDIKNNSTVALPTEQLKLSYHWTKDGEVVTWEGLRSVLEVDILPNKSYQQPLVIQMPLESGTYQLQLDMVIEGVDWLGQGSHHTIIID